VAQRVLVTGANGFVGRHVVSALAESGADLVFVVRAGQELPAAFIESGSRVVSTADVFNEDRRWWTQTIEGVDTFVHTAWYTNPRDYMISEQNRTCEEGTVKIAEMLVNSGIRRFVGLGTCLEYRQTGEVLTTETELRPESPYAKAKHQTYLRLLPTLAKANIEFTWCRLFYMYGPGEHESRLVPYLRREFSQGRVVKLRTPNQVLDFLDVRDVAARIAQVALGRETGALNICSGVGTSVLEMSMKVAREFGRPELVLNESDSQESAGISIIGRPSL
jgi:nucleoside-diphosphate-sugar epimerase